VTPSAKSLTRIWPVFFQFSWRAGTCVRIIIKSCWILPGKFLYDIFLRNTFVSEICKILLRFTFIRRTVEIFSPILWPGIQYWSQIFTVKVLPLSKILIILAGNSVPPNGHLGGIVIQPAIYSVDWMIVLPPDDHSVEYGVPELIFYQAPPRTPRLVLMRCCYENDLSKKFCGTRLFSHITYSTNSFEKF